MSLKETVRRLMGRSVVDLAQAVDDALARLAEARGLEAECEVALAAAQADVRHAHEDVAAARDALFREHPDLRAEGAPVVTDTPSPAPDLDPTKFEVVEVDDADDPRYTAGATSVSASDSEPLPPIVWGEHDG